MKPTQLHQMFADASRKVGIAVTGWKYMSPNERQVFRDVAEQIGSAK